MRHMEKLVTLKQLVSDIQSMKSWSLLLGNNACRQLNEIGVELAENKDQKKI